MGAVTQMNVRMGAELKRAGDASLAQAGYTPTQAVHALWSFAARHAGQPSTVSEALSFGEPPDADRREATARKLAAVERGARSMERFLISLGATPETMRSLPIDDRPYEQLRDEAFGELLSEGKGQTA